MSANSVTVQKMKAKATVAIVASAGTCERRLAIQAAR